MAPSDRGACVSGSLAGPGSSASSSAMRYPAVLVLTRPVTTPSV